MRPDLYPGLREPRRPNEQSSSPSGGSNEAQISAGPDPSSSQLAEFHLEAREQIADITKDSPGIFQGKRDELLADVYVRARDKGARESPLPLGTFPMRARGHTSRSLTRTSSPA